MLFTVVHLQVHKNIAEESDGLRHHSIQFLRRQYNSLFKYLPARFSAPCKFVLLLEFVMERGRVALRLGTNDVQCKTVNFNPASFQSNEARVNVHTSINYFNYSGDFIHDAAVTWIESVTFTSFKVCVLKAGRAERLTSDNGVTFVDYIAFQESPAGAESSHLSMDNWWDGTTCKSVTFDVSNNHACNTSGPVLFIQQRERNQYTIPFI